MVDLFTDGLFMSVRSVLVLYLSRTQSVTLSPNGRIFDGRGIDYVTGYIYGEGKN